MASVFYVGVLFGFWREARSGKFEPGSLVITLRTRWWPLVAIVAALAMVILVVVVSKAYDHSRWPMRHRGSSKAMWIGLIPVVSALGASCLAMLLFVRPRGDDASGAADTGGPASDDEQQAGPPCVRCQAATSWNETAQRFRCRGCGVYQPVGPKAM